jgi:cytochrome c biogenesis protein ResB
MVIFEMVRHVAILVMLLTSLMLSLFLIIFGLLIINETSTIPQFRSTQQNCGIVGKFGLCPDYVNNHGRNI